MVLSFQGFVKAEELLQPLPGVENTDINEFISQSRLEQITFEDDSLLDFQIQVPNDFRNKATSNLKNLQKEGKIFGEVFTALGPAVGDKRPYVTVNSYELDRLITAKDWLVVRALQTGITLRGLEAEDDNHFDAFYVRLDEFGKTEVVRARGLRHQDRLVMIEYAIPIELWPADKDKQILTVQSFEFMKDYEVISPEIMIPFSYLNVFSLDHPVSWLVTNQTSGETNRFDLSVKTSDNNDFLLAETHFKLVSNRSLRDRIDRTVYPIKLPMIIREKMRMLEDRNFEADPILERHQYDLSITYDRQITEVYPLRKSVQSIYLTEDKKPISHELWLTVIQNKAQGGKNFVISMIAPSRTTDLYNWAISHKAYKDMIESIR
jgi:hypothetical protein